MKTYPNITDAERDWEFGKEKKETQETKPPSMPRLTLSISTGIGSSFPPPPSTPRGDPPKSPWG
jgi:hypothetical protein